MAKKSDQIKAVGILTSGGDCPGLNAVIRAIGKPLISNGVEVIGFLEGFTGLVENKTLSMNNLDWSGLLTQGGTILRTSRNKPHKYPIPGGEYKDMTDVAVENYRRLGLDCLVCLGGGGTQKNALKLMEKGLNVITAPKTIDNDVYGTDVCFGYDTGMTIAAEAIDRLHTTASSHHRVMCVDIMGNNSGWLALGAGVAGGADVILIPEIPYSMEIIGESLLQRMRMGKRFSIVALAEGAHSLEEAKEMQNNRKKKDHLKEPVSAIMAEQLEKITGLETRVTSLGYLQRGGIPTPNDRILCTQFGTKVAELALKNEFGKMVAKRGDDFVAVPLEEVAGKKRLVTMDHPLIKAARAVKTCLGD